MGFGLGHNSTAQTLKKHFEEVENVKAEVIDLLELTPPSFKPFQSGYHGMLNRFPFVYHCLYDWTSQSRFLRYIISVIIEKMGFFIRKKLKETLSEFNPTRIVATHPFSLLVCPSKWLSVPTIGVVTDYELHPIWTARVPDILCVPKGLLIRNQLKQLQTKMLINLVETGFPISTEFYQYMEKEEAKQSLGLDERPVVLVMGGGAGLGPIEHIVNELNPLNQLQVVVLTGENSCLYDRLKNNGYDPHIRIEAFRSDIPTWMSASDLLVTKSGGVTINEAIAKRVPMFLYEAYRGQEQSNQQYLIHYGVAVVTKSETIRAQVEDFFTEGKYRYGVRDFFYLLRSPHAIDHIIKLTLETESKF